MQAIKPIRHVTASASVLGYVGTPLRRPSRECYAKPSPGPGEGPGEGLRRGPFPECSHHAPRDDFFPRSVKTTLAAVSNITRVAGSGTAADSDSAEGSAAAAAGANSGRHSAEVGSPGIVVVLRVGGAEAVAPDDVVGGVDGAVAVVVARLWSIGELGKKRITAACVGTSQTAVGVTRDVHAP